MSGKHIDLLAIVTGVVTVKNKITFNLVNYIDSKDMSWLTLHDSMPALYTITLPYNLYNNGKADMDGHIGEFWAILHPKNRRKPSILQYAKDLVGTHVVVSVSPKKYVFNNRKGDLKVGYSLYFNNMIEFEKF
jgi:hypothetical protein